VADSIGGDLALLHAFEQCGLGARRHAIDFIHEQQICKDSAGLEAKGIRALQQYCRPKNGRLASDLAWPEHDES